MGARKIGIVFVVAFTILSLGGVAARAPAQSTQSPGQKYILLSDPLYPTVRWKDERIISSKIPGRIERRFVEDGDPVEPDQVLAVLDKREAKLEYEIQKVLGDSDLAERVQIAKLDEYRARRDAAEKLIELLAISREEYRLAYVNVNVNELQTDLEAEKRTVEKLKADRAKVILDDHFIVSPMKGIVQKCFLREKESVPNNDLRMFRIVATDRVWVEGMVPASELFHIALGQRVEVRLVFMDETTAASITTKKRHDLPESQETFLGRIVFKDPEVNPSLKRFLVRAEVENKNNKNGEPILQAGLQAEMKIWLSESAGEATGNANP